MNVPGVLAGGATPVPIPNTEVKPSRADCTARATVWESRSSPEIIKKAQRKLGLFVFQGIAMQDHERLHSLDSPAPSALYKVTRLGQTNPS